MEVKHLAFDEIETSGRIRDLDTEKLERLRISMEQLGQMTPIEVQQQPGKPQPYKLIAGLHRIAAAEAAGLSGIDAIVYDGPTNANTVRLREIDENLARAELSHYDRANFIAERARLWVLKNGEIKQGRKKSGQNDRNSFIKETCEKFGILEREVRRSRELFEGICDQVWPALRGTHLADNASQLRKVKSLGKEEQIELLDRIRPSFDLPKQQFNRAFDVAYAAIKGVKLRAALTDDDIAEAMVRAYRDAAPSVQRLFRQKANLTVANRSPRKAAASQGATQ